MSSLCGASWLQVSIYRGQPAVLHGAVPGVVAPTASHGPHLPTECLHVVQGVQGDPCLSHSVCVCVCACNFKEGKVGFLSFWMVAVLKHAIMKMICKNFAV